MIMEINCENCGRCCFSPFVPSLINNVKDPRTKKILSSIAKSLIDKRIILLDKPFRNGRIFRHEMTQIINEGLIGALAQRVVAYIEDLDFKAVKLSLRHLIVPYSVNDKNIPVLACVFFESNSKKCLIYNTDFRPILCKVYPFNEIYNYKLLKKNGKLIDKIKINSVCGFNRIKGKLTPEQIKQIKIYYSYRHPIKVLDFNNRDGCIKSFLNTHFPFIPITDSVLEKLGFTFDNFPISDLRKNLETILRIVIKEYYKRYNINYKNPKLSREQKSFKRIIQQKINSSINWWKNFTLNEGEEINLLKIYEKLFMPEGETQHIIGKYYEDLF